MLFILVVVFFVGFLYYRFINWVVLKWCEIYKIIFVGMVGGIDIEFGCKLRIIIFFLLDVKMLKIGDYFFLNY